MKTAIAVGIVCCIIPLWAAKSEGSNTPPYSSRCCSPETIRLLELEEWKWRELFHYYTERQIVTVMKRRLAVVAVHLKTNLEEQVREKEEALRHKRCVLRENNLLVGLYRDLPISHFLNEFTKVTTELRNYTS